MDTDGGVGNRVSKALKSGRTIGCGGGTPTNPVGCMLFQLPMPIGVAGDIVRFKLILVAGLAATNPPKAVGGDGNVYGTAPI